MRRVTWERAASVLLLTPSVLAIAVFVYGFIGFTGYSSLTKWNELAAGFHLCRPAQL